MAGPWRARGGYHIRTITRHELEHFKAEGELPPVGFLSSTQTSEEEFNELEKTTGQ